VLEIADGGERWTPAVLFASTQTTKLSYCSWPNSLSELCSLDQPDHCFQAYDVSTEKMNSRTEGRWYGLLRGRNGNMTSTINKPVLKLRKAPQPPLSHPGATPDSDRAKRPPLADPSATGEELTPGDRVEGLGNFGKPTGDLGIASQRQCGRRNAIS